MTPCECKNDNFMCHAAKGCTCRHGFTGENCDQSLILGQVKSPPTDNSGYGGAASFGGILVALIFVAVIIFVIMYYKRRVKNLKTEIAHVTYIADPLERNNFDNPVYTFQAPNKKDNELLLNNTMLIKNNFSRAINGAAGSSLDAFYKEDELRSLKNREADATNPNIYHSIDKFDHVYDEIKQKENIEMEYDHLDYTRPQSSLKPHYQKMSSPFGSRDFLKEDKSDCGSLK